MVEFKEWPKIPRGGPNEIITITEKIDGTNACVIVEDGLYGDDDKTCYVTGVQSRTRLITPNDDNYGFATWVEKNKDELVKLGPGYHYGEWAGEGIQKNHHNIKGKKFFLFNSERWRDGRQERPACCECVPVLYEGPLVFDNAEGQPVNALERTMWQLWGNSRDQGYHPEGVVVWYHKGRRYEKHTYENAEGKWKS